MGKKIELVKLKAAVKRKWLAALRSGEYEQGANYLYWDSASGGKRYCCLGVLGAVCGVLPEAMDGQSFLTKHLDIHPVLLTDEEKMWDEGGSSVQYKLSGMNDNGWSFKRIAKWIEKNL